VPQSIKHQVIAMEQLTTCSFKLDFPILIHLRRTKCMEGSVPLATELHGPNPKGLSRSDKEAVALTHTRPEHLFHSGI
jgi:hypothetical protein